MGNDYELIIAIIAATALFLTLIVFIVSILLLYKRKKQQHVLEKQMLESSHAQALLQTQLEIQEQTLRTISQEIHDNVGQVLSLAKLNLNTLDMEEGANKLEKIDSSIQLVSKAINDLRDLSRSLNGDKIADLGLQDAIDNELRILQNTGAFVTHLTVLGTTYALPPQHEMVIFRIVQESLNNIVKHSRAKNIGVEIKFEPTFFLVRVADDGVGFEPAQLPASRSGIGFNNMKNRAALIGALFSIQSAPGTGSCVMIEVPQTAN